MEMWKSSQRVLKEEFFFEGSHLTLTQLIDFIYFWSKRMYLKDIKDEVGINSWTTAVDWANFIRDVCGLWYSVIY